MNGRNQKFLQKYGPWALITGASAGIGAEFARQLASKGLHVALAARRAEQLNVLADELHKEYHVQTRTIPIDLSMPTAPESLQAAVHDLEIGLFVNNAGGLVPGAFLKQTLADRTHTLRLNTTIPMQLIYGFGQQMAQRRRGGILLVSSNTAYIGTPYMADYAAAKAFLLALGEGLHIELKQSNVDVAVVVPGPTRTDMVKMNGIDMSSMPSLIWTDARDVAKAGIDVLGRRHVVLPGKMNKFMTFILTRVMSRYTASNMFGRMMKTAMARDIV